MSLNEIQLTLDTLPTSYDLSVLTYKTWKMARRLFIGDYVIVDDNPYVVILTHTASVDTRPGHGASWATYFVRALLPNTRYLIGAGTGAVQVYTTDGANAPAARGTSSSLEAIRINVGDETTAITTGTGKASFRMPYAFHVTEVRGSLAVAQVSGSVVTVDINEAGTSIISTKLTFDNTELTTKTAATPAVISDASLADDAVISIDLDQVQGSSVAAGLKITLLGYRLS